MVVVRDAEARDRPAVLALNEADLPRLSALGHASLERLAERACHFVVADVDGQVAAFLLVLPSEADHDSENFLWFKTRYPRFLYVDRIVVAPHARRTGVASRLYADLEAYAHAHGVLHLVCEINKHPANPDSLAFHDRHGFAEVGTKQSADGAKTLSMRLKRILS